MRFVIAASIALFSNTALAWDPWGDITHPERILRNGEREVNRAIQDIPNVPRNIEREVGNVGRELDRMRLEFNAVSNAPLLAAWLQASRNTANAGSVRMAPHIRLALGQFYDEDIYNRVSFKIGDGGALNLANLSIRFGDARAVTLIDTVIFADASAANDAVLWAHELWHVKQFRDWGVMDFSIRYLRSFNSVENEAYAAEQRFAGGMQASGPQSRGAIFNPFPQPQNFQQATMCVTAWGACQMNLNLPPVAIGGPCYCMGNNGPIGGQTR